MLPAVLQSLDPEAEIELFEVSGFNLNDLTETFRFCNFTGVAYRVSPTATPEQYQAIGCESDGYDLVGQGPVPEPTITLSNAGHLFSPFLAKLERNPGYRLEGATVVRRLTRKSFLEGEPNALAVMRELPPDVYEIEQLEDKTFKAVKLKVASAMDLAGATIPGRMALRSCPFRYRSGECGYAGTAMYDRRNQPTGDPKKDICSKSVTGCEARFGVGSILRFGGFPGMGGY